MVSLPIHSILGLALTLTTLLGSADVASCSMGGRRLRRTNHDRNKHGNKSETFDADFIYPRNTADSVNCLATPRPNITYQGGSVMTARRLNIYLLLVGTFTSQQTNYITNFVSSLGKTGTGNTGSGSVYNWWSINMKYHNSKRKRGRSYVKRGITLAATATISTAGLPTTLTSTAIWNIVSNYITNSQRSVVDTNGIYVVLTSGAYTQQNPVSDGSSLSYSCINFCGWHSNHTYTSTSTSTATFTSTSTSNVKFAWAGIPTQCVFNCSNIIDSRYLPAGIDAATYGAVSILAHEVAEVATDALGNAWYDSRGCENCDKCNYLYQQGSYRHIIPDGYYNLQGLNYTKYLVQMNWDPVQQTCVIGA